MDRSGDLFGRLVSDLFVSLGYDHVRCNIARSGREIDIEAEHRLEPRVAIAECKAMKSPAGGTDLNTLAGRLRTEKRRHKGKSVIPYFVSLSGFTETARDQELEAEEDNIITLDGKMVVDELVRGRFLVPRERAIEQAGRLTAGIRNLSLHDDHQVLAHEIGWIWAIHYGQGKQRTHFVLVHADGTPLSRPIAQQLQESDRDVEGVLHELACLNPEIESTPSRDVLEQEAVHAYRKYLTEECGYIQLDGLPADADAGTRRPQLENLFVPLHLNLRSNEPPNMSPEPPRPEPRNRKPVGEVLQSNARLAILASPGGGKSTLLKRLAVAYSDPSRRLQAADNLPEKDWFPLFLRCRELRNKVCDPFPELLDTLAERACIGRHLYSTFRNLVDRGLRDGRVLLLVDGLDEISNPSDRQTFVHNLRTFLGIYPGISLVVTSREAGFRHVAGLLATVCQHATLADFEKEDIQQLTLSWHREIFGDRPDVMSEAQQLASSIIANDRVRRLAVNPLLLTTLLLVKRWVGQLPTRRTVLYGKAIEVLLMTWNVEGHAPIEQDEALPQLCFLAHTMMTQGIEKISRSELARTLHEARQQLQAELAFARTSVAQFIDRIELRSSLLMMSGHDIVDGSLQEVYEFRHLTFQEYLAAKALVEGWYCGRQDSDTLESLLQPQLNAERWCEVFPLAAVLAGRRAEGLIQDLTRVVLSTKELTLPQKSPHTILGDCLADEAQVSPMTIDAAVRALVDSLSGFGTYIFRLTQSKYAEIFHKEARQAYFERQPGHLGPMWAFAVSSISRLIRQFPLLNDQVLAIESAIGSEDLLERCEGMLAFGCLAALPWEPGARSEALQRCITTTAARVATTTQPPELIASLFALGWIGDSRLCLDENVLCLERVFRIWNGVCGWTSGLSPMAAFCFSRWPLLDRKHSVLGDSPQLADLLCSPQSHFESGRYGISRAQASLVAAYYLRNPTLDAEIRASLLKHPPPPVGWKTGQDLLAILVKQAER